MLSIESSCYWHSSLPDRKVSESLRKDCSTQFAILGAGFTGLWTAHFIKKLAPESDITVVEQGVCGFGASGRNAGIVGTSIDHSHELAITHFGRDEAGRLARIGEKNIEELAEYAEGCDYEATGEMFVALNQNHIHSYNEMAAVAGQLGLTGYQLLSGEEARRQVNSPLYVGALMLHHGGVINPVKLVNKLKGELSAQGVRFFEKTRVEKVDGSLLKAVNGSVRAKRVVVAANAYTHQLFPELAWRFVPLYDYVIVSDPLSASQLESIGWKSRQGVIDGRTFFNYYRLTADNRILFGTSEAAYFKPNKVDESCDHSESHYRSLKESFKRTFPQLEKLNFPYAWGGPIASTTRLTPFFGSMAGDRILYGLGYTGHGIGSTRLAGKILAHMALSKPSELLKLKMVTDKPLPYPPEPVRSWAIKQVTNSLQRVDKGQRPDLLLKVLDALGIGFSS